MNSNEEIFIDGEAFAWLILWVVVAVLSFLLAVGINDGEGRKSWNHYNPMPEGVAQLDERSYIFLDNKVAPSDICRGTASSKSAGVIDSTTRIDGMDGLFVVCSREQTWNDHRPGSVDFTTAASRVATNPLFLAPIGLLLLICASPGLWELWKANRIRRRNRRSLKERERATKDLQEQMLRELTAAFARSEISTEEYEAGLERAYIAGVVKAQ